jgi:glycosyltransferase involved in cell wall biosynthesis
MKIFIFLGLGQDPEETARSYADDCAPDRVAYGFHLAEAEGFDVSYSHDPDRGKVGPLRRAANKFLKIDLVHAFRNRQKIRDADAVWAMSERESLAIGLLMQFGLVAKRPVISSSVWIWSDWAKTSLFQRLLYRLACRSITVMTVQSAKCLPIAQHAMPSLRTEVMHFGINPDHYDLSPYNADAEGPIRILAAGNDRTRDWTTLLAAFGSDERFDVKLLCSWVADSSVAAHKNVSLEKGVSLKAFRNYYRWADVIAIPMIDNAFSGITVALEAASVGRAILVSDTGGVGTYFSPDEAMFVPVEDSESMRHILGNLSRADFLGYATAANKKFVDADYTTRRMIRQFGRLTRQLVSTGANWNSPAPAPAQSSARYSAIAANESRRSNVPESVE